MKRLILSAFVFLFGLNSFAMGVGTFPVACTNERLPAVRGLFEPADRTNLLNELNMVSAERPSTQDVIDYIREVDLETGKSPSDQQANQKFSASDVEQIIGLVQVIREGKASHYGVNPQILSQSEVGAKFTCRDGGRLDLQVRISCDTRMKNWKIECVPAK